MGRFLNGDEFLISGEFIPRNDTVKFYQARPDAPDEKIGLFSGVIKDGKIGGIWKKPNEGKAGGSFVLLYKNPKLFQFETGTKDSQITFTDEPPTNPVNSLAKTNPGVIQTHYELPGSQKLTETEYKRYERESDKRKFGIYQKKPATGPRKNSIPPNKENLPFVRTTLDREMDHYSQDFPSCGKIDVYIMPDSPKTKSPKLYQSKSPQKKTNPTFQPSPKFSPTLKNHFQNSLRKHTPPNACLRKTLDLHGNKIP